MKQLHAHKSTHSEQQTFFHVQTNQAKQPNPKQICSTSLFHSIGTAQIIQRIPLHKAKQQTNIPPRNEHTVKHATPLAAKRSVVTSDATKTG